MPRNISVKFYQDLKNKQKHDFYFVPDSKLCNSLCDEMFHICQLKGLIFKSNKHILKHKNYLIKWMLWETSKMVNSEEPLTGVTHARHIIYRLITGLAGFTDGGNERHK